MTGSPITGSPRRGRAREDAILAAALELVTEIGYGRLTMDVIAARARASKATMYRKWPGKAELIACALRRNAEGADPVAADTGTLAGDLRQAVDGIAHAGTALLGVLEAVRDDPRLRDLVRTQIDAAAARNGRQICARAAGRGEPVDPARGPGVLRLAVAQILMTTLLDGAVPDEGERRHLVEHVLVPLLTVTSGDRSPA